MVARDWLCRTIEQAFCLGRAAVRLPLLGPGGPAVRVLLPSDDVPEVESLLTWLLTTAADDHGRRWTGQGCGWTRPVCGGGSGICAGTIVRTRTEEARGSIAKPHRDEGTQASAGPIVCGMNDVIEWVKQYVIGLDAVGWAIAISVLSAAFTWRGLRWQKQNSKAAARSADAAERSAAAEEKMLEATLIAANADEKAAAFRELTSANETLSGSGMSAEIFWEIEHVRDALYLLRNGGSVIATGVTADPEPFKGLARQLPKDAAVRAKESVEFLLVQVAQESTPHELWLTWDGQQEPVAVPIPLPSYW